MLVKGAHGENNYRLSRNIFERELTGFRQTTTFSKCLQNWVRKDNLIVRHTV